MSERFQNVLQREIAEEKAGTLGRTGTRLQDAVERLRTHDFAHADARSPATRDRLLWDLAERVEAFVVQREACGLRDVRYVLEFYGVPREAISRVGVKRPVCC